MMLAIPFPQIDPVIVSFGPFAVRWYALAYIAGLVIGWRLMRRLAAKSPFEIDAEHIDDFLVWATLGVILGGRIGYALFYNFGLFLDNPISILYVWRGGMSFHGGFLGVVVAGLWFCKRRGIEPLKLGDLLACVAPVGLFFGRIANFINGELFGRVSDVPWAMVFPHGGPMPRHPSQLYEAALEGLVLFVVLIAILQALLFPHWLERRAAMIPLQRPVEVIMPIFRVLVLVLTLLRKTFKNLVALGHTLDMLLSQSKSLVTLKLLQLVVT